ncbi:hypothetical protein HBK87_19410 [Streptomyces sp. 2BBP-J2]|uniref:hypothetical protein n=1 Tax=Streptomyces sp. 2BBP-J2 TaxID=2719381 RepID=UPI001430ABED|nr:hypothetical protein [Streptomyces sp. 2BBP-J2]NIL52712.1 hypothetical protein [Streptomyces sp. 2BBP-J2]
MEIARLVLDYLKVLVWPFVVLLIAHRFAGEIRGLLRRIRNLSAAGVDAEFSEVVEGAGAGAEAAARQTPPLEDGSRTDDQAPRPAGAAHATVTSPLADMAFVSPEGAIMAAWRLVEAKLITMVPGYEVPRQRGRLFAYMIRSDEIFPRDISRALHELRNVRNEVTHVTAEGRTVSPRSAADYVEGCESMVRWLGEYETSPAWEGARERLKAV